MRKRLVNDDEVNSSTIPLATEDANDINTEVPAPITLSPILQQYRIDEDFNDFPSHAVMREGGLFVIHLLNVHLNVLTVLH